MDSTALPYPDPRVDAILEDPAGYFAAANTRAYTQARQIVDADLEHFALNGHRPAPPTSHAPTHATE